LRHFHNIRHNKPLKFPLNSQAFIWQPRLLSRTIKVGMTIMSIKNKRTTETKKKRSNPKRGWCCCCCCCCCKQPKQPQAGAGPLIFLWETAFRKYYGELTPYTGRVLDPAGLMGARRGNTTRLAPDGANQIFENFTNVFNPAGLRPAVVIRRAWCPPWEFISQILIGVWRSGGVSRERL
jgi:hypothetical protein